MLARPGLPEFDYIRAKSPQEVFQLLAEKGSDLKLLLGGTDLFIQMRDRGEGPGTVLDLKGLPGMQEISFDRAGELVVGAGVTFNKLSAHPDVQQVFPVLGQAADTIGNYQLRNRATLGGNICNASPSADISPAALVYEGRACLASPRGERLLPLLEFWLGPGKTALAPDEYLKSIQFPQPPSGSAGIYLKLGRFRMGDLALVGVAVLGHPDPDCRAGCRFRIGVNSTAPTAYRLPEIEESLAQSDVSDQALKDAAQAAMETSAPIADVRATAEYQQLMVRNLTYKALTAVREMLP